MSSRDIVFEIEFCNCNLDNPGLKPNTVLLTIEIFYIREDTISNSDPTFLIKEPCAQLFVIDSTDERMNIYLYIGHNRFSLSDPNQTFLLLHFSCLLLHVNLTISNSLCTSNLQF